MCIIYKNIHILNICIIKYIEIIYNRNINIFILF